MYIESIHKQSNHYLSALIHTGISIHWTGLLDSSFAGQNLQVPCIANIANAFVCFL